MINEKELARLESIPSDVWDHAKSQELMATCKRLWKVTRSAQHWVKATPGKPAADAYAELVQELLTLHEDPHEG